MLFIFVFFALIGLLHVYVGRRLLHDTQLSARKRWLGWIVIAVLGTLVLVALVLGANAPPAVAYVPSLPAYVWLGCLFYLVVLLAVCDAGRVLAWVYRALARRARAQSSASVALPAQADQQSHPRVIDQGRRVLLARTIAGTTGLLALSTTVLGIRSSLGEISTPQVTVRLARLPKALDGFRIVQISDVHIGPMLGERFLRAVIDQVQQQRPDLIVITGDLVDGSVEHLGAEIALLQRLKARCGTYFVTGNHEYYSGCDAWVLFLEKLGIPVLMNERVAIGDRNPGGASFDLIGVPDHHARRYRAIAANMGEAVRGRDPERELVALAHQPIQFQQALQVGAGLQLSGHTHGGQIQPFGYAVMLSQPYIAGLHRKADSQIYVSRGTGFWGPPMRVLAPAEITTLHLVAG